MISKRNDAEEAGIRSETDSIRSRIIPVLDAVRSVHRDLPFGERQKQDAWRITSEERRTENDGNSE